MKDKNKKIILLVALVVAAYFLLRSNKKSKVEESQGGSSTTATGTWMQGNNGKLDTADEIMDKPDITIPVTPGITAHIIDSPIPQTTGSQIQTVHQEDVNVQTKPDSRAGAELGPIQTKPGSRRGEVQTKPGSRAGKVSTSTVSTSTVGTVDNNSLYSATVQYSASPEEKVSSAASGQLMYFKSIV